MHTAAGASPSGLPVIHEILIYIHTYIHTSSLPVDIHTYIQARYIHMHTAAGASPSGLPVTHEILIYIHTYIHTDLPVCLLIYIHTYNHNRHICIPLQEHRLQASQSPESCWRDHGFVWFCHCWKKRTKKSYFLTHTHIYIYICMYVYVYICIYVYV
jgi:hypothetical protein